MWLFRLKLENTGFINSRSLINKKKKKKEMTKNSINEDLWNNLPSLSLWKKKSSKIIRLSAFACHCSRVTLDSRGGCERASSSMRRGKIQLDWFPTLPACSSSVQGWTWLRTGRKVTSSDRTYSHSGRVFFPRTCTSNNATSELVRVNHERNIVGQSVSVFIAYFTWK